MIRPTIKEDFENINLTNNEDVSHEMIHEEHIRDLVNKDKYETMTVLRDGVVLAIGGSMGFQLGERQVGFVWALIADEAKDFPYSIAKIIKNYLKNCKYPILLCHVRENYEKGIKFLKLMRFKQSSSEPIENNYGEKELVFERTL